MKQFNFIFTDMEREIWKDIPGYEGRYQASNLGRIKSLKWLGNPGREGILKGWINGRGYKSVHLDKSVSVHSLVCSTFIGPRPVGLTIDHIDGDKTNNNLSNLRYLTNLENVRLGVCKSVRITNGTESLSFSSATQAAKYIGASPGLLTGQTKKGKLVKGWRVTYE